MIALISTLQTVSEESFKTLFEAANPESRAEMLEIREGMKKRQDYMESRDMRFMYFETAEEKLEKIREWYPRNYRELATRLPGFVLEPDDMPIFIKKMADDFVNHAFLPTDRRLLAFA